MSLLEQEARAYWEHAKRVRLINSADDKDELETIAMYTSSSVIRKDCDRLLREASCESARG